jgi:hypothetical protein
MGNIFVAKIRLSAPPRTIKKAGKKNNEQEKRGEKKEKKYIFIFSQSRLKRDFWAYSICNLPLFFRTHNSYCYSVSRKNDSIRISTVREYIRASGRSLP